MPPDSSLFSLIERKIRAMIVSSMKIVFLNIWGGVRREPLLAFLREQAASTDFFCLQEVFDSPEAGALTSWGGHADIFSDLKITLPAHIPYYAVSVKDFDGDEYTDFPLSHGIAIFAKKDIAIQSHGDFFIAGEDGREHPSRENFPHKLQ